MKKTENIGHFLTSCCSYINPSETPLAFSAKNLLLMAVNPHAELNSEQIGFLEIIFSRVVSGSYKKILEDEASRHRWVLEIATWINSIHAVNINK